MIEFHETNIGGEVIKDNETYRLSDNKTLNHLVLSQTILHPKKCTNGHKHDDQEEIYFFVSGDGVMEVGNRTFDVFPGKIVLIPAGDFHKVYNTGETDDLVFNCVFEGTRNH